MSTDYPILKTDSYELTALEHSGVFDIDLSVGELKVNEYIESGILTIAQRLEPEDLAEMALRLLQVVLFNCAEPKKMQEQLVKRVQDLMVGS